MAGKTSIIPSARIESAIYVIRDHKVMLDSDLARLYSVETKVLNQAVRRNLRRFPDDFMFCLTEEEWSSLRSRIVTLEKRRGSHRKYLPYAFTEQGVAMLSSVLKSRRAIDVNVEIMRAFVKLRRLLETHKDLARKLQEMEKTYDLKFQAVFAAIRELMNHPSRLPTPPPSSVPPSRKIGF